MTKNAIFALWLVSIVSTYSFLPVTAEAQAMEESISGASFQAIQAAMTELERNKLDVVDYRITVQKSASSIFVLFQNLVTPNGQRGTAGPRPGFSVELRRVGLQVVCSQFER
jgi:hypothetical protein